METYIEYLNTSTNNSTESEFGNFLKGGNLSLDGGFPPVYECESVTDTNVVPRNKTRKLSNINKSSIASILDNRRKTPFINVNNKITTVTRIDDVNSDSINEINKEDNIGGFLNLFETDSSSMNLPNEISIVSIKKESIENNIVNKDIVSNMNSESSIILPENMQVVNNVQSGGNNIINNSELIDSIMLPANVEIVDNNQRGGNIINNSELIDSIMLPANVEIVDNNQEGGNQSEDYSSSYIDSILLPNNIDIVDATNTTKEVDTVTLPKGIEIINSVRGGAEKEIVSESYTDTVILPSDIDVIDINQNGGLNEISSETELELPSNIEILDLD